jgi:hypothetical protein
VELTEVVALRAYAKMMNTLSMEPLESLLADDFAYESQTVFQALGSKQAFLEYITPKLQAIRCSNATVASSKQPIAGIRPCRWYATVPMKNTM